MQTRYLHLTDFKRRENGFQVYPHLKFYITAKIDIFFNLQNVMIVLCFYVNSAFGPENE